MELAMSGEAHVLWVVKGIQADPHESEQILSHSQKRNKVCLKPLKSNRAGRFPLGKSRLGIEK